MKKFVRLFLCFAIFISSSILFGGCSCSPGYGITVNFIEAPEVMDVQSYVKEVEFQGSHKVEFEIPEGYEEYGLTMVLDGAEIEYDVEYIKADGIDENHLYSVKKKITCIISDIKRKVTLDIDLTKVTRKTFDITLPDNTSKDFEVVVIKEEDTKRLLTLNSSNTVRKVAFNDDKVSVGYGEYIALVHTQRQNSSVYNKVYSLKGYFTNPEKIKVMNDVEYIEFPAAKRGNNYYIYGGETYSRIFYVGQIKESINLIYTLPNSVNSNQISVGENYNTFYLLTNQQKYNSDLVSIQTFVKNPNASYSISNSDVDKIGNTIISKITPTETYALKYDVHKLYLGDNLTIDPLLEESDKVGLNHELYIQVSSEIGLENLDMRLIVNEKVLHEGFTKLSVIESSKSKNYIKIDREILSKYYDKYEYEDEGGNVFEYYNGSAILYVGVSKGYVNVETHYGRFKYSSFSLQLENTGLTSGNYYGRIRIIPYIKDEYDNIDYGYMDYHINPTVPYILYLKTSKLFENDGAYKNTLYIDVYGEDYAGYTSTRINTIEIIWGDVFGNSLTRPALNVKNSKIYNGYKGYQVYENKPLDEALIKQDHSNAYLITAKVVFQDVIKSNYSVDFTSLNLPSSLTEGVYVTNNYNILQLSNFTLINYITKDTDLGFNFGYNRELYYVVTSKNLKYYEINMALDANGDKIISEENILYDIAGNEVTISAGGQTFVVMYKYMSESYEVPEGEKYHLCDNQ
jgi:hypothetical protein